jgi:carboxymethylenebutenolidase
MKLSEEEFRVVTPDGEMTTFVAHPDGEGPFPLAILYMDGIGYREQIRENARRFAAAGYYLAAPDLFYRSGQGLTFDMAKLATDGFKGPEAERLMDAVTSVTPPRLVADTKAILDAVEHDPAAASSVVVSVGYCMGARCALAAASALPDRFVAAAGIHPGALVTDQPDSPHHDLATVQAELYFAFAEIDQSATGEVVDSFREELKEQGVTGVVERLPGVAHGYAMADLPVYDENAAERHYQQTLDLWERNISPQPAAA